MRTLLMPPIFFVFFAIATSAGLGLAGAATLSGKVTAATAVAAPPPLSVAVDSSICTPPEEKTVPDPRLRMGEDRGLSDVVVTIRGVPAAPAYPAAGEAVLDQKGCVFVPHVVVVAPGQDLRVKNSDSILHTFRTIGEVNRKVNKAQTGGKQDVFTFEKPEILTAECDVHYWMSAVVVVAESAFTAVSNAAGEFEIQGLPEGKYDAEFWHQTLGKTTAAAEIGSDGGRVRVVLGDQGEGGSVD
jgi:plastocyanin